MEMANMSYETGESKITLGEFFAKIYTWMVLGILLSALFAYLTINTTLGTIVFSDPRIFYGIVAIEIAISYGVQILIRKLPAVVSAVLFIVYAAINGITLSGIFYMYELNSIYQIFAISAAIFATLAVIGFTTKKDLSSWGTALFAGALAVFVSSLLNIYFQNDIFDMIVSGVAVLVFSGLTVYDNQAYKAIYVHEVKDTDTQRKFVTLAALHMYINFVMIFINLLKFFGNRRN